MLVKEIYKPGVYEKNGELIFVTEDDVAQAFAMMGKLSEVNLDVPLILEHVSPTPNQREGVPMTFSEFKADELRRTVGRAIFNHPLTRINDRGAIETPLEFVDAEIQKKVESNAIKFVSPEIRPFWRDGVGRIYENVPTHIALTHRPIQVDQRPGFSFQPAAKPNGVEALALSDLSEPIYLNLESEAMAKQPKPNQQFAESDKPEQNGTSDAGDKSGGGPPTSGPPAPNPDAPTGANEDQKLSALLIHLKEIGLALPSDTGRENLVDNMLTAVMTMNAVNAKNQPPQQQPNPDAPTGEGVEEMQPKQVQFSDANSPASKLYSRIQSCVENGKMNRQVADELLVRLGGAQFSDDGSEKVSGGMSIADVIAICERQSSQQFSAGSPQETIIKRIKRLADDGKITPGIRDSLLARVGSLQFSDSGTEVANGGVSMTQLLETYENSASQVAALTGEASGGYNQNGRQFSATEVEHPAGRQFERGETRIEKGSDEAKQVAAGVLARTGRGRRKPSASDVEAASNGTMPR
jgi:hypothetical protein